MFSDDEIEDEIGELVENEISLVKNKKFVFHLSNEDAKILRDSISCGDFAGIRESLVSLVLFIWLIYLVDYELVEIYNM